MKNDVINVRDVIRKSMQERNYTMNDVCERIKSWTLFSKFMNENANLTFELANKIGLVLDIEPFYLIKNELKYMQNKDRKDYKTVLNFYKKSSKQFVKIPGERDFFEQKNEYVDKKSIEYLYENYINNSVIPKEFTIEEFKDYFKMITNIEDLNNIYFQDFQLSFKELEFNQALDFIFWTKKAEYEIKNENLNKYNRDNILSNLDKVVDLKYEENDENLKNKIINLCKDWGIIVLFKEGQEDLNLDGFCKWENESNPFLLIKDKKDVQENYKEFIKLFSYIIADSQQLYFYDSKLINFGEEYDNYIHDYQIIIANRFMKKYLNIESENTYE